MRFAYRLAAQLGIEDPIAMIGRMTPETLNNWMAFDALEPLGLRGACQQLAILIQCMLAGGGVESELSEFIPGYKPED